MELGEKLRRARLEAGFSQRALCGDEITRNMLSQIEHGTAKPSMATLKYLAGRLGKPVSYFLEEDAVVSVNREIMKRARDAYDSGAYELAFRELTGFREPDEVYEREWQLLRLLVRLELARSAIGDNRLLYARELLEGAEPILQEAAYGREELERSRLLLLAQCRRDSLTGLIASLPSLDAELCLRARGALDAGQTERAAQLLDAAEDRKSPHWCLLRGEVCLKLEQYREAAAYYTLAEPLYPRETASPLEQCYRELQDYRQAYNYACKSRSFQGIR